MKQYSVLLLQFIKWSNKHSIQALLFSKRRDSPEQSKICLVTSISWIKSLGDWSRCYGNNPVLWCVRINISWSVTPNFPNNLSFCINFFTYLHRALLLKYRYVYFICNNMKHFRLQLSEYWSSNLFVKYLQMPMLLRIDSLAVDHYDTTNSNFKYKYFPSNIYFHALITENWFPVYVGYSIIFNWKVCFYLIVACLIFQIF